MWGELPVKGDCEVIILFILVEPVLRTYVATPQISLIHHNCDPIIERFHVRVNGSMYQAMDSFPDFSYHQEFSFLLVTHY